METVLRVLLREPTNEAARRKVAEAVQELGLPDYPRPDQHVEVLPAGAAAEPVEDLLPATAERPVEQALAGELRTMFGELLERLDRDRRERVEDLALTTDLVTEGWRNIDRRLGRLEKIVERIDRLEYFGRARGTHGADVRRLDDARRRNP